MGKFIDLTGQRFGRLTVIRLFDRSKYGYRWECKCDCGGVKIALGSEIKRGYGTSCGRCPMIDLKGQKFGKLLVVEHLGVDKKNERRLWLCICDCGNEKEAYGSYLLSGRTNSCGCAKKENMRKASTKHGYKYTRLYGIWSGMKNRCTNPKVQSYPRYGGRGIVICDEWSEFVAFKEWAIQNGYRDDLSIDRIDGNGNYEPSNCRWADGWTQALNKGVPSINSTGVKGVSYNKRRGQYEVYLCYKGKRMHFGSSTTLEEAAGVRKAAEETYLQRKSD